MLTRRKAKESAGRSVKGGRRLWAIVGLVAFLMVPTAGKADWEAEWERAVAAAKKEGKLIAEISSASREITVLSSSIRVDIPKRRGEFG